jgi:hypothetical protein
MEQQEELDLRSLLNGSYENKWIAIAPDYSRVLDAADSLGQLMRRVADHDAIFHRVLPNDVSFVPATLQ